MSHEADESFKLQQLSQFMRKQGLPWKEIFWKIWAALQSFKCVECGNKFTGTQLNHCARHPLRPIFQNGANIGV